MKNKLICALLTCIIYSCSSDNSTDEPLNSTVSAVTALDPRDVANSADGTDLEFSFTKPLDVSQIEEFRVYIVKSASKGSFDVSTALDVSTDNYLTVESSGNSKQISFASNSTDIDGDAISEGVLYNLFVLSKASGEVTSELSEASIDIQLERKSAVRTLTDFIPSGSGGMDSDANGNIYMGDFGVTLNGGGTRVFLITPEGEVSTFANGLNGASGNDFDDKGNLYQSNITSGTISKITPDGTVSLFASGLSGPVGIAFDGTSNFYVCNCGGNTISKIDIDGNVSSFSSGALFSCPNGIDIDEDGNLYVVNFNNSTIVKILPDGSASSFATVPGNNNGHILIHDDIMYIAGRGLNSIYTIDFQGVVTLFAGTGGRGLDNGSLDQATFSLPNDFALSPDGTKLYVNDKDPAAIGNTISPVVVRVIDIIK